MKKKVAQQIEKMERKFMFNKRLSTIPQLERKIKTEPQHHSTLNIKTHNLMHHQTPASSQMWERQSNYPPIFKQPYSQRQKDTHIVKKYFDLQQYKAESQNLKYIPKRLSLNLPKLKPNFQTQLYSEISPKKIPKEDTENTMRQRAMQKVDEIYACEQRIVNQKYEKITKIKNRLKLLDRIKSDRMRLEEKYVQLRNS